MIGYRHPEFAARVQRRGGAEQIAEDLVGRARRQAIGISRRAQGVERGAPRDASDDREDRRGNAEARRGVDRVRLAAGCIECAGRDPECSRGDLHVAADGVRECGSTAPRSTSPSWDGTPIDVNVAFPAVPSGTDGNYPLIIIGHGYGGSKIGFGASGSTSGMREFTSRGYAVFSMTDRGFHESCGSPASITAGGLRLRQRLHPPDGRSLRGPRRPVLRRGARRRRPGERPEDRRDRRLLRRRPLAGARRAQGPRDDARRQPGSLDQPGQPPARCGSRRRRPIIPWSDLAYSLTPNGSTLDYVADSAYSGRTGIEKESFQSGLYLSGAGAGPLLRPGAVPLTVHELRADVTAWKARLDAGEPYDGDPTVTGDPRRDHGAPLRLLHRPLRAARAAADLERLHRRPLPGRRGDPLLQPDPLAVPERADLALLRRLRAHARGRTSRPRPARSTPQQNAWLDYYVKGAGLAALPGRHRLHAHLSDVGALRRAVPGRQLGGPRSTAWCACSDAGTQDDLGERRIGRGRHAASTRSAAAGPARRPRPTISPAWRPTACRPRRATATR